MRRTRYGEANPERVEDALWEQAIRRKWTAWQFRQHLNGQIDEKKRILNLINYKYKDYNPGSFWILDRIDRTNAQLKNDIFIHVDSESDNRDDNNLYFYQSIFILQL